MPLKPCFTLKKGFEKLLLALFHGPEDRNFWTVSKKSFLIMNWEDLVAPIANADKIPELFEQTLQAMYQKYVGAEARNIQFEYF
jgi:hypothetical protein